MVGHALKKVLRVVADQQERDLVEVAKEAGAELICGNSLKAALDRDWDQQIQKDEALTLVLNVLQAVETWVQTLQQEDAQLARSSLSVAQQIQAQDVEVDEKGKTSLIKGVAKDRRISIEDSEMRHGRKSRSVRVDGYKRHMLHDLGGLKSYLGWDPKREQTGTCYDRARLTQGDLVRRRERCTSLSGEPSRWTPNGQNSTSVWFLAYVPTTNIRNRTKERDKPAVISRVNWSS